MARLSVVRREAKRSAIRVKYCAFRVLLKGLLRVVQSRSERQILQNKLYKLPRDSSIIRRRNRCAMTGRGRGTYRLFGLSRIPIREMAAKGELPGVTKSSW